MHREPATGSLLDQNAKHLTIAQAQPDPVQEPFASAGLHGQRTHGSDRGGGRVTVQDVRLTIVRPFQVEELHVLGGHGNRIKPEKSAPSQNQCAPRLGHTEVRDFATILLQSLIKKVDHDLLDAVKAKLAVSGDGIDADGQPVAITHPAQHRDQVLICRPSLLLGQEADLIDPPLLWRHEADLRTDSWLPLICAGADPLPNHDHVMIVAELAVRKQPTVLRVLAEAHNSLEIGMAAHWHRDASITAIHRADVL
mmetsp:Transcript_16334/g.38657  ORF Transcript_16334/g.38657 Transcript_16334/m.38657 type:complete len:253 (+) Transcript_16334:457-1215(+)